MLLILNDEAQRILKCILGILSGFWILNFNWVKTCLSNKVCEWDKKIESFWRSTDELAHQRASVAKTVGWMSLLFWEDFKHHRKDDLF